MRRLLVLTMVLVYAAGCDRISGSGDPTMDGEWSSVGSGAQISFTAVERGGQFSGSGMIRYSSGPTQHPAEVSGVNSGGSVSFTLVDRRGFALTYQGRMEGSRRLTGTMHGFSDGSFPYTFERR
jgi:hypothetical protein